MAEETTNLLPSSVPEKQCKSSFGKASKYLTAFVSALLLCGLSYYAYQRMGFPVDHHDQPSLPAGALGLIKSQPAFQTDAGKADQILSLPALSFSLPYRMASGYLKVHNKNNRNLFYWFVEAVNDPYNSPIVIWQNGGPGSSSIGAGFFMSHGPVHLFRENETLYANPHSWNKVANIIFLENPVGVGFSYSDVKSDYYEITDEMQKRDTAHAVQAFFKKFPEFSHLPVFCGGESYGGHYVPNMVDSILQMNRAYEMYQESGILPPDEDDYDYSTYVSVNVQGFMVGNGLTNGNYDFLGTCQNLHDQHYISDKEFNLLVDNCDLTNFLKIVGYAEYDPSNQSLKICHDTWNEIENINRDTFNIYNLHDPNLCQPKYLSEKHIEKCNFHADPTIYLNMKQVQKAIHANASKINLGPQEWRMAAMTAQDGWKYSFESVAKDIMPLYHNFLDNYSHLRMLVYSGSYDVILPTTGTLNWLKALRTQRNMTVSLPWSSWSVDNSTVSGFTYALENQIRFASVLEAGHVVPMDQPKRALELLKAFLLNTDLPFTSSRS